MQITRSSLIKFSSVTFWLIRRFKEQKPLKEVQPLACHWSKLRGCSVKFTSVLLLYVQTFWTESGCISLSVSSSKQWPQKRVRSLKAYLQGTTLSHATSLGQAYDMTQDNLHAHDIFTYDMPKSRAIPLVSAAVIVSIICKRRKRTSSSLHSDIIFSVSSSENVFFALEAVFDFPEATSSAILTQENFTFLPYSVEICHKIRHFLSISATIVAAF